MDTTFNDFRDSIKNVKGSRNHKVKGSYGMVDYYKYYREIFTNTDNLLTRKQYSKVIKLINSKLTELLINGNKVVFPCNMGFIELVKCHPTIDIVDGKVRTTLPIDWDKTLRLWNSDADSFNKKRFVRTTNPEIYKVIYDKHNAKFKNKIFYKFRITRTIKSIIKDRARNNTLDALLYNNN